MKSLFVNIHAYCQYYVIVITEVDLTRCGILKRDVYDFEDLIIWKLVRMLCA